MKNQTKKWEVVSNLKIKNLKLKIEGIIDILLENRGLKNKKEREEFVNPLNPLNITFSELGISEPEIRKTIKRLEKAKKNKEKVIIYGDYDADGICATAILWETLYSLGLDVIPYLPDRFSEGYGINAKGVENAKSQMPNAKLRLIITVDNGIVANDEIEKIDKLGIDVIVTDHHLPRRIAPRERKRSSRREERFVRGQIDYPKAYSIIHTPLICGAALAWILSREIEKRIPLKVEPLKPVAQSSLELAGIGTIADQMPLIGVNRSFAKYGLEALRNTDRPGLLALFREVRIEPAKISTYEVNYLIAPRINAMGRLEHAMDSLRLLCTKKSDRADDLARHLSQVNYQRQKVVDEVLLHAKEAVLSVGKNKVIILAHESYHEGVIGLAAGKLVEEFYKPAIVISKGKDFSKASARSISGFNIIESIRKLDELLIGGGGHPMAAGFTIKTSDIEIFIKKFNDVANPILTDEVLTKKLKIDCEIDLDSVNQELSDRLEMFEPSGIGNSQPTFLTRKVEVTEVKQIGRDLSHLKLVLRLKTGVITALAWGFGELYSKLSQGTNIDIVYAVEKNVWNGNESIQLKIKDIKLPK